MRRVSIALVVCILSTVCALGQKSPFVGTWKSNPEKSNFTGGTYTVTKTAKGYHFSYGGGLELDLATDGKEYARTDGDTVSWKQTGPGQWETETKTKGVIVSKGRHKLSSDGKTDTVSYTTYSGTEVVSTGEDVRSKVSEGEGLVGTWKTVKTKTEPYVTIVTEPSPGRQRWETPKTKEVFEGPTDGTPFPMSSPTLPDGWIGTMKLTGPRTMEWTGGFKDKPMLIGTNVVSEDGKTMTSTYWSPGKESEKSIEVDELQ